MDKLTCQTCGSTDYKTISSDVYVCNCCGAIISKNSEYDEQVKFFLSQGRNMQTALDFKMAKHFYQEALKLKHDLHEAYFGMFVSDYGIEYVLDKSSRFIPTCHKTSSISVYDNINFQNALSFADAINKEKYIKLASEYETLRKKLMQQVDEIEDFEIFICYKSRQDNNIMSKEHEFALDLYYELKDNKKVFFADKTLSAYAGLEYEPIIFKALQTCKLMFLVGFSNESINSVWVKNEWQRFLEFRSNIGKRLVLLYKNLDISTLPESLKSIQHIDCNKLSFIDNIRSVVDKTFAKSETNSQNHFKEVSSLVIDEGIKEDSKVKIPLTNYANAFTFLENKQFNTALTFFRLATKEDNLNPYVYYGILRSMIECDKEEELPAKISKLNDFALVENIFKYVSEEEVVKFFDIFKEALVNLVKKKNHKKSTQLYNSMIGYIKRPKLQAKLAVVMIDLVEDKIKHNPKEAYVLYTKLDKLMVYDNEYISNALKTVKRFRHNKKFRYAKKLCSNLYSKTKYIYFEYELLFIKYKIFNDSTMYKHFYSEKKCIALLKLLANTYHSDSISVIIEGINSSILRKKYKKNLRLFKLIMKHVPSHNEDYILFYDKIGTSLLKKGNFIEAHLCFRNIIETGQADKDTYLKKIMAKKRYKTLKKLNSSLNSLKNDEDYLKYKEICDLSNSNFK